MEYTVCRTDNELNRQIKDMPGECTTELDGFLIALGMIEHNAVVSKALDTQIAIVVFAVHRDCIACTPASMKTFVSNPRKSIVHCSQEVSLLFLASGIIPGVTSITTSRIGSSHAFKSAAQLENRDQLLFPSRSKLQKYQPTSESVDDTMFESVCTTRSCTSLRVLRYAVSSSVPEFRSTTVVQKSLMIKAVHTTTIGGPKAKAAIKVYKFKWWPHGDSTNYEALSAKPAACIQKQSTMAQTAQVIFRYVTGQSAILQLIKLIYIDIRLSPIARPFTERLTVCGVAHGARPCGPVAHEPCPCGPAPSRLECGLAAQLHFIVA